MVRVVWVVWMVGWWGGGFGDRAAAKASGDIVIVMWKMLSMACRHYLSRVARSLPTVLPALGW